METLEQEKTNQYRRASAFCMLGCDACDAMLGKECKPTLSLDGSGIYCHRQSKEVTFTALDAHQQVFGKPARLLEEKAQLISRIFGHLEMPKEPEAPKDSTEQVL